MVEAPPKRGWEDELLLLAAPAGPPGKPETGDEVSKPVSWFDVYICGAVLTVVSGRAL